MFYLKCDLCETETPYFTDEGDFDDYLVDNFAPCYVNLEGKEILNPICYDCANKMDFTGQEYIMKSQ